MGCFSLSFVIVHKESLIFQMLIEQRKQFEDVTLDSGKQNSLVGLEDDIALL